MSDKWTNNWGSTVEVGELFDTITITLMPKSAWVAIQVEATQVGDLAVHKDINNGSGWAVSHIPTLLSIAKAVPEGMHTKKALINWCKKVQEICAPEWAVLHEVTAKTWDDAKYDDVKQRLMDMCLSIKVE